MARFEQRRTVSIRCLCRLHYSSIVMSICVLVGEEVGHVKRNDDRVRQENAFMNMVHCVQLLVL